MLDFVVATDSPYLSDWQEPESIIAMLTNDLVAIDCKTNGYPCFKNPYAMDFNESPVTCCRYLVDCPGTVVFSIVNLAYISVIDNPAILSGLYCN